MDYGTCIDSRVSLPSTVARKTKTPATGHQFTMRPTQLRMRASRNCNECVWDYYMRRRASP